MRSLAELRQSFAGPGRVTWIGLRPARKQPPVAVESAVVDEDGLQGDHGRPGKRAVTLIQAEHLPVVASLCGREIVTPEMLRRNIVVAGLNLSALRDTRVQIGGVILHITGPCAPCSRMEDVLGPGGYTALRGHGGWCAGVERPGEVAIGAEVRPLF
ncbi:MOSC domain-containing protein [Pseudoponticoccus marisrubri]|uniref:Sulfurase n=1 Tax=Pseudoponticoccus marisrubri TaxID=1685382 RepID=A0A0W7WLS7_9RHOB|nr:MOSC domain-containing protein [Pseudoponticoccus marisrubri]KUF11555.1 sulfurase [Pseudoponticoccus marisrubri]